MHRSTTIWIATLAASLAAAAPATGQTPKTNIYRYVLDVDAPEPAGLVALDLAGAHVLRGSAPKPISATIVHQSVPNAGWTTGAAVDIVPYFFLGGGARRLPDYRANSVAGRLTRVITKTALSVAAGSDPAAAGSLLGALGIRTTFHDPHDPVLNSRLPEQVDSALRAHGIDPGDASVEDVARLGVDLGPLFADATRRMRARGDIQVSAGWGLAGRLRGAALDGDSTERFRHTLWLTGQHSLDGRLDLLVTWQVRSLGRDDAAMRLGAGLQRKSTPADYRIELYYDRATRRLHPGASVEVRALPGVSAVASLVSDAPIGGRGRSYARAGLMLRYYATSRP
ncbi:MAG: hypothetical protein SFV24_02905 [Gemmatimonadales bacterium]|nr:hypothetical protein [Gemmatimonadales bacterium]